MRYGHFVGNPSAPRLENPKGYGWQTNLTGRIISQLLQNSFTFVTQIPMMQKRFQLALVLVLLLSIWGCATDFEVYAPDKEIRSVYCVLNPRDTAQYVRVAKAFQVRGDAIQYAAANDFSMHGLDVKLTSGNKTWTAIEVPNFPKDSGAFLPMHTVYKFVTDGTFGHDTLAYDKEYTLEIGTPDAPGYVTAKTWVPPVPKIRGDLNISPGAGNQVCLPRLQLENRYSFIWRVLATGVNYEVRVGLNFEANGVPDSVQWGPSGLFTGEPKCKTPECTYQFSEKELLREFLRAMPVQPLVQYTYDTRDSCAPVNMTHLLPRSLWFEVTAVDQYLSDYMIVNDPAVLDLTGARPEYTNLTGNIDAIGIFGSYNTDRRYAIMQACSEYLLGLNGVPQPIGCTW